MWGVQWTILFCKKCLQISLQLYVRAGGMRCWKSLVLRRRRNIVVSLSFSCLFTSTVWPPVNSRCPDHLAKLVLKVLPNKSVCHVPDLNTVQFISLLPSTVNVLNFSPSTPTVVMGTTVTHPLPDRVKPSFVIFDIRALWRSNICLFARQPVCYMPSIYSKPEILTNIPLMFCAASP